MSQTREGMHEDSGHQWLMWLALIRFLLLINKETFNEVLRFLLFIFSSSEREMLI